ncbi:hypothetical protein BRC72_07735 [Halobacteriales archaeon QH_7_66_36]|nr:MAG: hypothetical protein BRC72_07735 [Halobacteriales archaeon QH_7_66_36]
MPATIPLTGGVRWINECFAHEDAHEHVSVYLIETETAAILIDSGSFYHREAIAERIDQATGGDGPEAIVLSHSDYPHAGNISTIRDRWDDVELVASSGSPELQGLSDAQRCTIGDSRTVLDRRFSFVDPPLADRSHTAWIYDHGSGVLFTADGFGSYHEPADCDRTSRQFEDNVPRETIYQYHANNLAWLRYVDPEKLEAALASIFETYDISYVAPIHGHPISGRELPEFTNRLVDVAGCIASEYEVPEP